MLDSRPVIIIPFDRESVNVAAGQARHFSQTGHARTFSVVYVADTDVDTYGLWKVLRYAKVAFEDVQVVQPPFRIERKPDFSWDNWMVQTAVIRHAKDEDQELLFLPPDCMTVHPDWFGYMKVGDRRKQKRTYPSLRSVKLWMKAAGDHRRDWFHKETSRGFELLEGEFPEKYGSGVGLVHGKVVETYLKDLGSRPATVSTAAKNRVRMRRWAAIGDVIASTSVARKLHEQGVEVHLETFSSCSEAIFGSPFVASVSENGGHDINLDLCYENHPEKASRHIADLYFESSARQLKPLEIELGPCQNYAPVLSVSQMEQEWANGIMSKHPKPWTVVCPRSHMDARSIPANVVGLIGNRVPGTVFWCSNVKAPDHTVDLSVRTIRHLMAYISQADLVVSVDSAPLHIAAGLKKPILAIRQSFDPALRISNQRDYTTFQRDDLPCLPCNAYMCNIDKDRPPCGILAPTPFSKAINDKLDSVFADKTSAIIPVYKPKVDRLNRCLVAILPQVDEVVIGVDGDGVVPHGTIKSPKIKWVKHKMPSQQGYGHTCNLAARESTGRYLLMLNDDCFASADMVKHMKTSISIPNVAVVGGLLRYPSGMIQHGGTVRVGTNFGHRDHMKPVPSIRNAMEMEFVTFAAALVKRSAFYDVDGFDERYFLYSEDADICLRLGEKGWKIIYNPAATGIHEESQTTSQFKQTMLAQGNALFHSIWGSKL